VGEARESTGGPGVVSTGAPEAVSADPTEAIFTRAGEAFVPSAHARGPWDPRALHGGAPAALIATAFERMTPGERLRIARLSFEFLRPVPFAPLTLATRIVRPGRRVQELAAELRHGDETVCRAAALRVQEVPDGLPAEAPPPEPSMPGPQEGRPVRFALDDAGEDSFAASAMEMRWLDEPFALGPARVWQRLRHPLLAGEPLSALARLAASADFGNGVSAALPFDRFLFINADLTVHLHRLPVGEWIGLDARTVVTAGGMGMSESVLHDLGGPVGRAFQTLVVQPR
jgi:hypothetical protein